MKNYLISKRFLITLIALVLFIFIIMISDLSIDIITLATGIVMIISPFITSDTIRKSDNKE